MQQAYDHPHQHPIARGIPLGFDNVALPLDGRERPAAVLSKNVCLPAQSMICLECISRGSEQRRVRVLPRSSPGKLCLSLCCQHALVASQMLPSPPVAVSHTAKTRAPARYPLKLGFTTRFTRLAKARKLVRAAPVLLG